MRLALVSAALLCVLPARAATKYPPAPAQGCLYDGAHLLSAAQVAALHQVCGPLNRSGVAVLFVATLTAEQLGDAAPTEDSRRAGARRGAAPSETNGSALLLSLVAMLGLLAALASSAMRRTFPGKKTRYAAAAAVAVVVIGLVSMAHAGAGWITLLIGLVINGLVYLSIRSHKCPKDGSWMLIDEQILEHPTYFSDGVAEVFEHCTSARCG